MLMGHWEKAAWGIPASRVIREIDSLPSLCGGKGRSFHFVYLWVPIFNGQSCVSVVSTLSWWHCGLSVSTHVYSCGLPISGVLRVTPLGGFNHLLASFSQDPEWASAGRDPERVPSTLGGEHLPSPLLLQGREAVDKNELTNPVTLGSPLVWKRLPTLIAFQSWLSQHWQELPSSAFHCQGGPTIGSERTRVVGDQASFCFWGPVQQHWPQWAPERGKWPLWCTTTRPEIGQRLDYPSPPPAF